MSLLQLNVVLPFMSLLQLNVVLPFMSLLQLNVAPISTIYHLTLTVTSLTQHKEQQPAICQIKRKAKC